MPYEAFRIGLSGELVPLVGYRNGKRITNLHGSPPVDPPVEPPITTTLLGVGSYSNSLVEYPRTGPVYTGDWWVDPNLIANGNGSKLSPFNNINDALSSVQDGQRVIIRGGEINLTSRIERNTSWNNGIEVFAYGTERVVLNGSAMPEGEISQALRLMGSREHWKGFYAKYANGEYGSVYISGTYNTVEDFWVSHNSCLFWYEPWNTYKSGGGFYLTAESTTNGSRGSYNNLIDCATWRLGKSGVTSTNVADGIVATAWDNNSYGVNNNLVRCFVAHGPDDSYDLFRNRGTKIIDSVAYAGGYLWDSVTSSGGDGGNFKMGGTPGGGNSLIGSIGINARGENIKPNTASGNPGVSFYRTTAVSTTGSGWGFTEDDTGSIFEDTVVWGYPSSRYIGNGINVTRRNNNWTSPLGSSTSPANPMFADTANWDFSLLEGSSSIGAGYTGGNLGASTIALEIAKEWLNKDLTAEADLGSNVDPGEGGGVFSDGYDLFGVEGRESFSSASPTLKDGSAITGQMETDYNGIMYWVANNRNGTGDWSYVNYSSRMSQPDSYDSGRDGEPCFVPMSHVFRLTGDLRFLDEMVYAYSAHRNASDALVTEWEGWSSEINNCSGTPWSPDKKSLYRGGGGTSWQVGTDLSYANTNKLIAMAAEFTWMLWINRNKTSPNGYDYQSEFNAMKPIVEGYVNTWMGTTGACWEQNYKGNSLTSNFYKQRAADGVWPMCIENGSHSAAEGVMLQRYLGLLGLHAGLAIPNPQGAIDSSQTIMETIMNSGAFVEIPSTYGQSIVHMRTNWLSGNDDRAGWATYTSSIAQKWVSIWLTGAYRQTLTKDFLTKHARSYAMMHYEGVTSAGSFSTRGDILEGHLEAGFTNTTGFSTGTGSPRTVRQQSINGFTYPLVFADGAALTKLQNISREIQVADAGGYTTPNSHILLSSLFVQQALDASGDLDGEVTTPPPSGTFSDGIHTFGLEGNESFNPASPTLKDGTEFTSEMSYYYTSFFSGFTNPNADSYNNVVVRLGTGDAYGMGRHGQVSQDPAMVAFRLTGDLRILDHLITAWNGAYNQLTIEFEPPMSSLDSQCNPPSDPPWSPYRKWLYVDSGTDTVSLQEVKPRAINLEFVWALHQNQGKTSPAGHDYAAELAKWKPVVEEYVKSCAEDSTDCWATSGNYRRVDGGFGYGRYRTRQNWGQWPIHLRTEGHAVYNSILLQHYLGLLGVNGAGWDIPNPVDAYSSAIDIETLLSTTNRIHDLDDNGRPKIVTKWNYLGSTDNSGVEALRATYTGYQLWSLTTMKLTGVWDDTLTDEVMLRFSRAYAEMHNADGTTNANFAAGQDRVGHGLNVSYSTAPQRQIDNARKGYAGALIWAAEGESGGTKLWNVATTVQNAVGGGYTNPTSHALPASQFIKRALQASGHFY